MFWPRSVTMESLSIWQDTEATNFEIVLLFAQFDKWTAIILRGQLFVFPKERHLDAGGMKVPDPQFQWVIALKPILDPSKNMIQSLLCKIIKEDMDNGHGPYFFLKMMWVCVMWDRQTFWPQCIACPLKKIYFEKTKKSQLKAGRTAIIINILKFLTFLLSSQAQKRHLVLAFVFILCPQIIKDLLFSKICHQLWVQPLTRPPMVVFSLKKIRPLYWLWTSFWFPQDI